MNLHEKLLEIRKSVTYLKKENIGYQYRYVSSSQALSSIRVKMDELGVLLLPSVAGKNILEYQSKKEGNLFLTGLDMVYTWVDSANPSDKIELPWYAQGSDVGEKGVGKAFTYGEKYFILKFFNIPTDTDDPDSYQEKQLEANKHQKKMVESPAPAEIPVAPTVFMPPREPGQTRVPPVLNPQVAIEKAANPYVGKILGVSTPTSGVTNGKEWTRWDIDTAEMTLGCFSREIADVCADAMHNDLDVELIWRRRKSKKTGVEQSVIENVHIIENQMALDI